MVFRSFPPGQNPLGDPLAHKPEIESSMGSHQVAKPKPNSALGKLATAVKVVAQVIFGVALSPVILPALLASKRSYTHEGLGGKADRVATKVRQFFAKVFSGPLAYGLFGESQKDFSLKAKFHEFAQQNKLTDEQKKELGKIYDAVRSGDKDAIIQAIIDLEPSYPGDRDSLQDILFEDPLHCYLFNSLLNKSDFDNLQNAYEKAKTISFQMREEADVELSSFSGEDQKALNDFRSLVMRYEMSDKQGKSRVRDDIRRFISSLSYDAKVICTLFTNPVSVNQYLSEFGFSPRDCQQIARVFENANMLAQPILNSNLKPEDQKIFLKIVNSLIPVGLTINSASLEQSLKDLFLKISNQTLTPAQTDFLKTNWNLFQSLFPENERVIANNILQNPLNKRYKIEALVRCLEIGIEGNDRLPDEIIKVINESQEELIQLQQFFKQKQAALKAPVPKSLQFIPKFTLMCELKLRWPQLDLQAEQLDEVKTSIFGGIENQLVHGKKNPQLERLISENISQIRDEDQQKVIRKFYADASDRIMLMNHPPREGYEGPRQFALKEIGKVLSRIPSAQDHELKGLLKVLEKELRRLQGSLEKPLEFKEIEELIKYQPYPFDIAYRINTILGELKKMGF